MSVLVDIGTVVSITILIIPCIQTTLSKVGLHLGAILIIVLID